MKNILLVSFSIIVGYLICKYTNIDLSTLLLLIFGYAVGFSNRLFFVYALSLVITLPFWIIISKTYWLLYMEILFVYLLISDLSKNPYVFTVDIGDITLHKENNE